ncbi:MAG: Cytidylate kinase [Deltaproteobacteria bacterium ADurb.Bin510]|nr:MAG: Cytidylate kinase [Deltaproteobacteria bacterium ADurb.Bin510]
MIFPAADLKLYLDASSSERARRRQLELAAKGVEISVEQIKREIEERDERDSNRKTSPLCIPEGAIVVDTTHLTLAQVRGEVLRLAKERLA